MSSPCRLHLFQAYGVELEYMIVDRDTLDVRPIADELFAAITGVPGASDAWPDGPDGTIAWSNELTLHLVEFKTAAPHPTLDGLGPAFQAHVARANALLAPMNAQLLPTGMHPWMQPDRETRLWPHENNAIYAAYDRIFGCKGHGWGNLQSTHLNLPFAGDEEYGALHAAIRLVLPLIPALAASSPIADGAPAGKADYRMEVYRTNSQRVPQMAGLVIPEPVFTEAEHDRVILQPLYDQLAPLDPDGVLRHPFANGRGGMSRFDRGSIEIRLIDIQECPTADLAIVALVAAIVRALAEQRLSDAAAQRALGVRPLHAIMLDTIADAERAVITDSAYLRTLGLPGAPMRAGEALSALFEALVPSSSEHHATLGTLVRAGTLSTRIMARLPASPTRDDLRREYAALAGCLAAGTLYGVD
jgi:carboxylate-amine ligase